MGGDRQRVRRPRRDLNARRLHGGPPFAVLVLDGYGKRPIAPSIWARLAAAAGRDVAIGVDPPQLLLPGDVELPAGRPDRVRICGGAAAGREGSFVRAVGRVRWPGGLESDGGLVRMDPLEGEREGDGAGAAPELLVPLADLEALA